MSDFVNFKLAQRLKEKGFTIPTKSIFGMYNEIGVFHTLTTSADYDICDSGFKCRCYYDYDDFDERDFIAPTISQVLKWLREEKKLFIEISCNYTDYFPTVRLLDSRQTDYIRGDVIYSTYEQAALAGVNYCLENLI